MAEPRHYYGTFTGEGAKLGGEGLTCERIQKGVYDLTYERPYSSTPAVIASQIYNNKTDFMGGDTRDNLVVVYVRNDKCRITTGASDGSQQDRDFSIAVLGPQY